MNAEAHQEAIPACTATWKRTRYLMEEAQAIGKSGVVLSSELGLDVSLRPGDALDGVLDGKEPSCAPCRHRDAYGETERTTGRERRPVASGNNEIANDCLLGHICGLVVLDRVTLPPL